AHSITLHRSTGRRASRLSRREVERRPMPRARDDLAVDVTLRERTAAVRATVPHRVDTALDVEQRDFLTAELDARGLAGRQILRLGHLREVTHDHGLLAQSAELHARAATPCEVARDAGSAWQVMR